MATAVKGYRVIGAAAVIRKNGHERYVPKDGTFAADQLDDDNAKHLLSVGLIESVKVEAAPAVKAAITQADVAAAVKAATEAQATELAAAKTAAEAQAEELKQAQDALAAAKAETEKAAAAAKSPAAKPGS